MTKNYATIKQLLDDEYDVPDFRPHYPPVDELVLTILSQNTSDKNSVAAYQNLIDTFDSWETVRDADVEAIKDAIRSSGLANQKAPRIQRSLRKITEERGEIELEFLQEMPIEEAKAWLTDIKGIGPKTAAIVLLFGLDMKAFPVDTHVHRVSERLGLIDKSTSREKAHDVLEELVPQSDYYAFHIQLIQHGRQVCNARSPKCSICVLQDECDYFNDAD